MSTLTKLPLLKMDNEESWKERQALTWRYLVSLCAIIGLVSCLATVFFLPVRSSLRPLLGERRRLQPEVCDVVPERLRFDCHPEDGASEASCLERRCCWKPVERTSARVSLDVPYCYYPRNWTLYGLVNSTGGRAFYRNIASSAYKKDIALLSVEAYSVDDSIVRIEIADASRERYEPRLPVVNVSTSRNTGKGRLYVETGALTPGFRAIRSSDGETILDTTGFIFADQFLQISVLLAENSYVYGLGEHRSALGWNTGWETRAMFNKDQPPTENANLYGSQPFALIMMARDYYVGLLFLNSNAMEVTLQPTPAITYRSIGGIFDFYVMTGASAADVIQQYSRIVGKPLMPPYWSLGFHLCRYGYGSLEKTKSVWLRTRAAGIPFDTQWNDLDYMKNNNDFTYDPDKFEKLPEFVEQLHKVGMHYVPLIDPGISASEVNGSYRPYDEGIRRDIFVKEANSDEPFRGKVWNGGSTVWPDFTNPESVEYWHDMMKDMWDMFPYDGAWIDMNEPANFYNGRPSGCERNDLDNPIYVPKIVGNLLATKTLCMNARHYLGSHYNVHNTYGMSEAVATNRALVKIRQRRAFVISRATWIGQGYYSGHWSGDVYSTWHDMRMSVPQLLTFGLFHIPMTGADICGFNGNTTRSLCNRWSQLGAFYPFSRNHNSDDTIEQDPVAMGPLVVNSTRKALLIRYRFLPYLYTLFFRAHVFGETVARPLFFEFSNESATWNLDSQFLWGSSLMIVPVFEEKATQVRAYLPRGTWYDYYDKKCIDSSGHFLTLPAPLDTIPLLVRGGSILPGQTPGRTTTESRLNPFELLIGPDDRGMATGQLYWDDGDSLDSIEQSNYRWLQFNMANRSVYSSHVKAGKYTEKMILGKVEVMGLVERVNQVSINGIKTAFRYDEKQSSLTVENLEVDLTKNFKLSWK